MALIRVLGLLVLVGALGPASALAYSVEVHVGAGGGRMIVGPDDNFWLTSGLGLSVVDRTGRFIKELQTPLGIASDPADLVAGPDGNVWYSAAGRIGRVTPQGNVQEFDVGPPVVRLVHPLPIPIAAIAAGPDGHLWFTETGRNEIGRLTTSGALTRFPIPSSVALPFQPPTSSPRGIAAGPDGNLWFTESATDRIGRITPAGVITEFALPAAGAQPFGIAAGPDGALWFTEEGTGSIGRITTDGAVTEFRIPGYPRKIPGQIAAGPDGAVWFTWVDRDRRQGGLGRITPAGAVALYTTHAFNTSLGLPSDVLPAADGSVWFAAGAIGRLVDSTSGAPALAAAVLPGGRSGLVGMPITVFASLLNHGATGAAGCRPELVTPVPAILDYAPTDPATNATAGPPNTPVGIAAASQRTLVLAFTATAPFPPTDVTVRFLCDAVPAAPVAPGVNTLVLSASTAAVPDIVALARTTGGDQGILTIHSPPGSQFFSVATANLGAGGPVTVTADTGGRPLPLGLALCPNDAQARCLQPMAPSVTVEMPAGGTTSFIVQATAAGTIPLDPANNRVVVRFADATGAVRAVTSVAVQSPAVAFTF